MQLLRDALGHRDITWIKKKFSKKNSGKKKGKTIYITMQGFASLSLQSGSGLKAREARQEKKGNGRYFSVSTKRMFFSTETILNKKFFHILI